MEENKKTINQTVRSYALFLIGLMIASMGVALSTKAGLGTSPVASVPYSVSLVLTGLSFGGWLNVWSITQILVQIIILRGRCKWVEIIIQTILALVYGNMTNFSCRLIQGITVDNYAKQLLFLALSCFVLGFGLWLQFKGGVAMLPGEAMNRAISVVSGRKYENIKILFDILYILVSVAICLIFVGQLSGVREGSIIAAVSIGFIIKGYNRIWDRLFRHGKDN